MLKLKSALCAILATFVISTGAQAVVITANLGEFSFDGGPAFPSPEQIVGTFIFALPAGDTIVSASLAGTFGNSVNTSSAPFDLYGDGVLLGQCLITDPCFEKPPAPTPFDFAVTNLADLLDGQFVLSVIQTAEDITRLGPMELTINTLSGPVSPIPLPAALPLMAGGLGLMGFLGRRRQSATA